MENPAQNVKKQVILFKRLQNHHEKFIFIINNKSGEWGEDAPARLFTPPEWPVNREGISRMAPPKVPSSRDRRPRRWASPMDVENRDGCLPQRPRKGAGP
ncbi:MAG: hypothetical protein ABSH22_11820 [Tepidisphaeraceae bacterium]